MTRMTPFSSPLLLGFDTMEKTLERLAKSGDSYPPYNIERLRSDEGAAKASHHARRGRFCGLRPRGHDRGKNQLVVRGRQSDDTERQFLHRGIAARQFQRCFVLADGMRVTRRGTREWPACHRSRPARAGEAGAQDRHFGQGLTRPGRDLHPASRRNPGSNAGWFVRDALQSGGCSEHYARNSHLHRV